MQSSLLMRKVPTSPRQSMAAPRELQHAATCCKTPREAAHRRCTHHEGREAALLQAGDYGVGILKRHAAQLHGRQGLVEGRGVGKGACRPGPCGADVGVDRRLCGAAHWRLHDNQAAALAAARPGQPCTQQPTIGRSTRPSTWRRNAHLDVGAGGDVGAAVGAVGSDAVSQEAQLLRGQLAVGHLQAGRKGVCVWRSWWRCVWGGGGPQGGAL